MAARLTKKNSAFLAFQQAELDFDSDGSEDERALQEQKEKQKAKKKSSKKKKSSESSSLKELAMLPVSAGKKSKAKSKSGQSHQTTSELEEAEDATPQEDEWALALEQKAPSPQAVKAQSNAKTAKPTHSAPVSTRPAPGSVASIGALSSARPASASVPTPAPMPVSVAAPAFAARTTAPTPQPKVESPSPRKPPSPPPRAPSPQQARPQTQRPTQLPPQQQPQQRLQQPPQQQPQQLPQQPPLQQSTNGQNETMGAIYSPTHITVTRADGQVSRKIGVAEMMDQLVRFQHHNSQLTLANRSLQEQRQRDANIITTLQNDVNLFRQMCLSLQAEATQLRALAASAMNMRQTAPSTEASLNGQPPYGRGSRPAPPPGMS